MHERCYPFEPIILPYQYDELEPYIGEETVKTHYEKHYKGYVSKLNGCVEKNPVLRCMDIESLAKSGNEAVRFYAGGVLNHEQYFLGLYPVADRAHKAEKVRRPTEALFNFVRECGGAAALTEKFSEMARNFKGSGYIWAVCRCGKTEIVCSEGQVHICGNVLLCCDLWEHAYYLDYRSDREKYVRAWARLAIPNIYD